MEPTDQREIFEMPTVGLDPQAARNAYDVYSGVSGSFDNFFATIQSIWDLYTLIAFILSAFFIYRIIYSYLRINELGEQQAQHLAREEERWRQLHDPSKGNRRWQDVEAHVHSVNPNDWKLAIIEADVMLEKMLEEAGFAGVTIADRLRSASGRSFATIEDAWQAHRVRNQIAHGGTDFVLTQKMAQSTIIQYRRVFEEFKFI